MKGKEDWRGITGGFEFEGTVVHDGGIVPAAETIELLQNEGVHSKHEAGRSQIEILLGPYSMPEAAPLIRRDLREVLRMLPKGTTIEFSHPYRGPGQPEIVDTDERYNAMQEGARMCLLRAGLKDLVQSLDSNFMVAGSAFYNAFHIHLWHQILEDGFFKERPLKLMNRLTWWLQDPDTLALIHEACPTYDPDGHNAQWLWANLLGRGPGIMQIATTVEEMRDQYRVVRLAKHLGDGEFLPDGETIIDPEDVINDPLAAKEIWRGLRPSAARNGGGTDIKPNTAEARRLPGMDADGASLLLEHPEAGLITHLKRWFPVRSQVATGDTIVRTP